jgi:hypothetical protein
MSEQTARGATASGRSNRMTQRRGKLKLQSMAANFFKLWKDADADSPVLKQAKSEYAKLEQHD